MGKKGELTKARIVKSTIELLKTKSLNDISVREICEKTSIAKGSFYVHFEAKEDVAWTIIDYSFGAFLTKFESLLDVEPSFNNMEVIIDQIIDFTVENKSILELIHHVRFTSYINVELLEQRYFEPWNNFIEPWIKKGVELKVFNVDNTAFISKYITISIHETIDQLLHGNSDYELEELRPIIKNIIFKLLS